MVHFLLVGMIYFYPILLIVLLGWCWWKMRSRLSEWAASFHLGPSSGRASALPNFKCAKQRKGSLLAFGSMATKQEGKDATT